MLCCDLRVSCAPEAEDGVIQGAGSSTASRKQVFDQAAAGDVGIRNLGPIPDFRSTSYYTSRGQFPSSPTAVHTAYHLHCPSRPNHKSTKEKSENHSSLSSPTQTAVLFFGVGFSDLPDLTTSKTLFIAPLTPPRYHLHPAQWLL